MAECRFSVIIACHNEAATIERKLANTFALSCAAPFEVLVIDDGSTDGTLDAVHRFRRGRAAHGSAPALKVLTNRHAAGKNGAVRTALERATGAIHLITDADVELGPSTLEAAWRWFDGDPRVGGLCLTPCLRSRDAGVLRQYAAHYEPFNRRLKMLQSRIDSVPMLHGQAMFVRAAAAVVPAADLPADDVDLAMQIRRVGYRVRYAADLPFFEELAPHAGHLDRQKIRRAKAVMRSLWRHRGVLCNPRYGAFGMLCVPIDVFLYFGLAPVCLAAGVAGAAWVVVTLGVPGLALVALALAAMGLTPLRAVPLYLRLLLTAAAMLCVEHAPRIRWKPQRHTASRSA